MLAYSPEFRSRSITQHLILGTAFMSCRLEKFESTEVFIDISLSFARRKYFCEIKSCIQKGTQYFSSNMIAGKSTLADKNVSEKTTKSKGLVDG